MKATQETDPCTREKGCINQNDPAGTDPHRNNFSLSGEMSDPEEYTREPENHPSAEERLLHPDKGE